MRTDGLAAELRAAVFATGCVWLLIAATMLAPMTVDLIDGDGDWQVFAVAAGLLTTLAGIVALATRGPGPKPTPRFGFILVVMLWVATPLAGAIPFALTGMSPADAVFESVSGFTTTGSTVMAGLDAMPRGVLLWRSMTHWLGGVGILALGLAVLPFLRIGGMQLFSKESSDQSKRPLPRFDSFARSLIAIYLGLSALCALGYASVGMGAFDAITHAMGTVSTGGFSNYDASMGHFEGDGVLWVGSLFMILGALPFSLFIALLFGRRPGEVDPQIVIFFVIILLAVASLSVAREGGLEAHNLAETVFNVISVLTTTGFAAEDYQLWGGYAVTLFMVLTILGGCAGSTSGGVKAYRVVVTWALMRAHLTRLVSPNAVTLTRYGARQVDPAVFRSALVFMVAFMLSLIFLTLALGATGLDLLTALTAAMTTLANVGPGLGPIIGPAGNFASISDAAKWLCSLGMLLGRLEILPVLVLLTPEFWRR